MLDGKLELRNANIRWLRSQIGHVGQTPTLFHGSVRENIELGFSSKNEDDETHIDQSDKSKQFEQVVRAAKIANAHDFISALPQGYNTQIGEGGAQLSGGQKQRICIARSLVRDPKILLLDESTSNLDSKSESVVQEALQKATENRTTLIIAHRLGTIRRCDKIMVLNDGKITEQGKHEELAKNEKSIYYKLMKLQDLKGLKSSENLAKSSSSTVNVEPKMSEEASNQIDNLDNPSAKDMNIPRTAFQLSKQLLKIQSKQNRLTLIGLFGSAVLGIAWPLAAACISELLILGDIRERSVKLKLWSSLLVCCGLAAFFGVLMQNIFLSLSAEKFTKFIKLQYFNSILSQDLSFFDKKENSVGSLVFRLNNQMNQLKGLTSDLFGSAVIAIASLFVGIFLACFYCWRVALVAFIFMPGIFLSGVSYLNFSIAISLTLHSTQVLNISCWT